MASSIEEERQKDGDEEMKVESEGSKKQPLVSPAKSQAEKIEQEGGILSETFFGQLTTYINYKSSNEQEPKF